jgi:hypothetical protein
VLAAAIVNHAAIIVRQKNAAMLQRHQRIVETDVIPRSSPDVEIGAADFRFLVFQGPGKRQKSGSHVASDTNGLKPIPDRNLFCCAATAFPVQETVLQYRETVFCTGNDFPVQQSDFPHGKWFCSAGKRFPAQEMIFQYRKMISRPGNGFPVQESDFPHGKWFSSAGKWFPAQEMISQCRKMVSRTGIDFPAQENGFLHRK